ncbi:MAG TPA: hypothetical protein VI603_05220 [Saprospiraceae bacterium]|nr:hypothetical protein [Saprospiraceae bacterium]
MKLDILQESIEAFADVLQSQEGSIHLYKYDMLANFRTIWTFSADDFTGMYDRSLQSDVTRRWWKRDHYRPKEMMLVLIKSEEQYVRQAFKELFQETKNIENRVDSFIFYCDELLRMYKRANPKSIENNHYQDSTIISLYLAGMYPERYTLYPGRVVFNKALHTLHAKENPDKDDLARFFKVSITLYQFLMKNESVKRLIESNVRPSNNLLLSHELVYFLSGNWKEMTP